MRESLDGQAAIVTGASSGIGEATAYALAREGADVALAARRAERLDAIADDLETRFDVSAAAVPTDVQEPDQVEALVETAVERFGGLDLLVNNAGLARGHEVAEMTDDEFLAMQRTNVNGVFYATRAALPHLEESAGTLVFVGSFAGKHPRPYNPVYAATKWWVRGFAQSVSAQVGDEDVAVTTVNPAAVRTEFEVGGVPFEERFEPGEVVEPEEVADAIVFAAKQQPSMASEIDIYDRDKFTMF